MKKEYIMNRFSTFLVFVLGAAFGMQLAIILTQDPIYTQDFVLLALFAAMVPVVFFTDPSRSKESMFS